MLPKFRFYLTLPLLQKFIIVLRLYTFNEVTAYWHASFSSPNLYVVLAYVIHSKKIFRKITTLRIVN